jgi:hypothetical protein
VSVVGVLVATTGVTRPCIQKRGGKRWHGSVLPGLLLEAHVLSLFNIEQGLDLSLIDP